MDVINGSGGGIKKVEKMWTSSMEIPFCKEFECRRTSHRRCDAPVEIKHLNTLQSIKDEIVKFKDQACIWRISFVEFQKGLSDTAGDVPPNL